MFYRSDYAREKYVKGKKRRLWIGQTKWVDDNAMGSRRSSERKDPGTGKHRPYRRHLKHWQTLCRPNNLVPSPRTYFQKGKASEPFLKQICCGYLQRGRRLRAIYACNIALFDFEQRDVDGHLRVLLELFHNISESGDEMGAMTSEIR